MADTVHKSVEGPAVNNQTNGLDWTWQELPVGCDCCGDGPQVGAAQVTAACGLPKLPARRSSRSASFVPICYIWPAAKVWSPYRY
jgi:hypothetical protein